MLPSLLFVDVYGYSDSACMYRKHMYKMYTCTCVLQVSGEETDPIHHIQTVQTRILVYKHKMTNMYMKKKVMVGLDKPVIPGQVL